MKTVAVLGANGRLGAAAAKAFLDAGYRVVAITRNGRKHAGPEGVVCRAANALDRRGLTQATEGADVIFNGLNPPYPAWRRECPRLAENVISAAGAHKALHLFPGNVYNYGSPMPVDLNENTTASPTTAKGRIRIAMEETFRSQAASNGVRTIVLRAGDFFGTPGTGSWFDLVIAAKLARGKLTYPGPLHQKHAWAYLPDLAATFVGLADAPAGSQPFEVFHFPGHTVTGAELKTAVESAVGRDLQSSGLPWPVLKIGGLVVPMWREINEMRYLWDEPHELVSSSLAARVGRVPHTPFKTAIHNALVDLGHLPDQRRMPDADQIQIGDAIAATA